MKSQAISFALAIVATSALLSGCGPKSNNPHITGKVILQGAPLESATLMFFPPVGRSTAVPLETDGTYSVTLPPGDYRVTVQQGAIIPDGWKEGDPIPPPDVSVPKKYFRKSTTILQATVAADQTEPIDFTLE